MVVVFLFDIRRHLQIVREMGVELLGKEYLVTLTGRVVLNKRAVFTMFTYKSTIIIKRNNQRIRVEKLIYE
jgi:hypothetical protein